VAQDRITGRHPARVDAGGRRLPAAALALLVFAGAAPAIAGARKQAPPRLADTGLYADAALRTLAPGVRTWTPQYPLWTDGASKRRWILLPPGRSIDASDPDAWVFPVGTRLWKEFSFQGRPAETRYMERLADGSWLYATYRWSEDGAGAVLAPGHGVVAAVRLGGGSTHDLPSTGDCEACHAAGRTPVLGFSALQLSPDRDPLAPHAEQPAPDALDLSSAVRAGMVRRLPQVLLASPPRIQASTPVERAALGYLHGNCGGCHDLRGELASVGLDLVHRVLPRPGSGAVATGIEVPSRYQPPGVETSLVRIAPGLPGRSALLHRLSSRSPADQMPPIGTHLVDEDGVRLITEWIASLRRAGRGQLEPPATAASAPVVER
jgi:hypothetical protein